MTITTVHKAIDLLTEARKLIEQGDEAFICDALRTACPTTPTSDDPATCWILNYVADNLEPFNYFSTWLSYQLNDYLPFATLQLGRLAWIDRMIHQLKLDGTLP